MTERADPRHLAWSVFWQADHLQACAPRNTPEALALVQHRWQRFVTKIGAEARLLDLGTGNGALALLALHTARAAGYGIELHGVDSALIDPPRFVTQAADELRAIHFHAGVTMEQLPFADAHFDAVVAQYALEYSDTTRSVAEFMRVLRPGGNFLFLLHAEESVITLHNRMQADQAEKILQSPLFRRLRAMLPAIYRAQAAETTPGADIAGTLSSVQQHLAQFTAVVSDLQKSFAGMTDVELPQRVIQAVQALTQLRLQLPESALLQRANDIETLLRAQALRLRDMEKSTLSASQRETLMQLCQANGAHELSLEPAHSGDSLLGFWLQGQRQSMLTPRG